MESKTKSKFSNFVTWSVFLITLLTVIITLTSAIFPNLLLSSLGGETDHLGIDPTEKGVWGNSILMTNLIVFGLAILYFRKKLPSGITRSINFIFNFEVSSKVAFLVIVLLLGFYIFFSVGELFDGKFQADYNERVKGWLENFSFTDYETEGLNAPGWGSYLHIVLGLFSIFVFDNVKIIPFFASISLLVLTYFITLEITKKRFAGLVAFILLLQSGIFLHYDTGITYPNFWILLYLFSLYLIYKKWTISPLFFISSIFTKLITAAFLPMTFFFVYRATIPKKNKIILAIVYGIILVMGLILLSETGEAGEDFEFDTHDFWGGFNAIHSSLRFDPIILLFILPLIVGLFFKSRNGFKDSDSIMFLILGILLSAVFIPAFGVFINAPYRFVPLAVFFAIGVGMLLSKKGTR